MFACDLYPTDPAFLRSVTEEATHQVEQYSYLSSAFNSHYYYYKKKNVREL